MRAATIVPQHHLHLTEYQDYHLALAHLVGKKGFDNYTDFYKRIGQDPHKFLILDNGLIEGDPRPIEEMVEKAGWLRADELVLPDVYMSRDETYREVHRALDKILAKGKGRGVRRMAVAQGRTIEEWLASARELLKLPINTLGIPKVVAKLGWSDETNRKIMWATGEGGFWLNRLEVLRHLEAEIEASGVQIHLLGCWDTPLELKTIASAIARGECPEVRGTDSAIAYAHARIGQKMSEGDRPEGAIDFGATDLDPDDLILKYNIQMWQHECQVDGETIPRFW